MSNYRSFLSCFLGAALFFCVGCSTFYNTKTDSSQQVPPSSDSSDVLSTNDSQVVQADDPLILGDSNRAGALSVDCLNSTGKEISAFYIKLSSQDMYDENLMPAGRVWGDKLPATVFFCTSSQKSGSTGNPTVDMSGVFSDGSGFEILDLNLAEMKKPNLQILDGTVAIGYIDQNGNPQYVKSTGY